MEINSYGYKSYKYMVILNIGSFSLNNFFQKILSMQPWQNCILSFDLKYFATLRAISWHFKVGFNSIPLGGE